MRVLGQRQVPVGMQSFEEIVSLNLIRADKSMFIKAVVESGVSGVLILRPRRFGKSLNMSMLKEFLDINSNPDLFVGTLISECTDFVQAHQNQYPVILLRLSTCSAATSMADLVKRFSIVFSAAYEQKSYIYSGLTDLQKKKFDRIKNEVGDETDIIMALDNLVTWLHTHHKKKVFILIDEYDTILQNARQGGFLKEATAIYGAMLEIGSKNNGTSPMTVLFGIHNTSLGLMESSTNHLFTCSFLSDEFNTFFGFTEEETREIIRLSGTSISIENMLRYYNGYTCGKITLLNPWSVMLCIRQNRCSVYWPATASKHIIKNKITKHGPAIQGPLSHLTRSGTIKVELPKLLCTFETLENNISYFWLDLLLTGYVKIKNDEPTELEIPNEEIRLCLESILMEDILPMLHPFINCLNNDNYNLETFYTELSGFLGHSTSCYDFNEKNNEKDYRKFFTGVLFLLSATYEIHTEVETSGGRSDHCAIPKDRQKAGVIFELKANVQEVGKLHDRAVDGAKQLIQRGYHDYCTKYGIEKAWLVSLSFFKKEMAILYSKTAINATDDATNVKWTYLCRSTREDDIVLQ